jgi:acetyl-CoA carboxylase/biotin carboxylase 1
MQWHRSGLIASWEFLEEHIERKNGFEDQMPDKPLVEKHREQKWGAMVIIKSLQFLPAIISAALRETVHDPHETISNGSLEPTSFGNMMHIALVGINNPMSLLQDRYSGCFMFPFHSFHYMMLIALITFYYTSHRGMFFI